MNVFHIFLIRDYSLHWPIILCLESYLCQILAHQSMLMRGFCLSTYLGSTGTIIVLKLAPGQYETKILTLSLPDSRVTEAFLTCRHLPSLLQNVRIVHYYAWKK